MESMPALFVNSFDGNHDIWGTCFDIYDYFWTNSRLTRYLVTNNGEYERTGVNVIRTGEETAWVPMTIEALSHVQEEYIFHVLEDQLISKQLSDEDVCSIVSRMQEERVFYYRMTATARYPKGQSFIRVPENTPYPISLQPAIWHREFFKELLVILYEAGCRTPWDFERFFMAMYREGNPETYIEGIRHDSRDLMGYQNALIQGKWDPRVVLAYRRLGIRVSVGDRGYMPLPDVVYDALKRNKLVGKMGYENQRRLKAVLRKVGFKFMT